MESQTPKKGFALAGFILGIASIALGYETWYLGVAAGVVGLILSIRAKKSYQEIGMKNGMAQAGFILSIVGLGVAAMGLVMCITCSGCIAAGTTAAIADGALTDVISEIGDAAENLTNIGIS